MEKTLKIVLALAIVVAIPAASIPAVLYSYDSPGPSHVITALDVLIGQGSTLNISNSMNYINPGYPGGKSYYAGTINFVITSYKTITGSWTSTSKSTMWISKANQVWMELPAPATYSGSLNMSLSPGSYTLTYGGFPGDRITVTSSVTLISLTVRSITSLDIPVGTVINATQSEQQFSFDLAQNGTIVGAFNVTGPFDFSVYSPGGPGFAFSSDRGGSLNSGNISSPLEAGQYTVSFSGGFFRVTSAIMVLNINQG